MALEIFVSGDIEKALARLKRNYQKELSRDLARHSFYESRGLRARRKRLKAIQRLKKLESRSILRVSEAKRLYGKRTARLDTFRPQRGEGAKQG